MSRYIPLQWFIPGLVLLLFSLVVVGISAMQYMAQRDQRVEEHRQRVGFELAGLQHQLEDRQRRGSGIISQSLLNPFLVQPDYRVVALVSPEGNILLANRVAWRDTSISDVAGSDARWQQSGTHVLERRWIEAALPLQLDLTDTRRAMLYARYDLQQPLAQLRRQLVAQSLGVWLAGLLIGALLLAILQYLVFRPLQRFVQTSARMAQGEYGLQMGDFPSLEFSRLAAHFNHASRTLAETLQTLRERQTVLEAITGSMPDLGLIVAEDGTCLNIFGNRALLTFQAGKLPILDRKLEDYVPEEMIAMGQAMLLRVLDQNQSERLEYDMTRRGMTRHFSARVMPLPIRFQGQRAIMALISDETETHTLVQEIRLMATAFETHEGIMITGADGHILRVNHAFEEITGYGVEEVRDRSPELLYAEPATQSLREVIMAAIEAEDHWNGELWFKRRNGTRFPVQETISCVRDEKGQISAYVTVFMDITERKNAEKLITWQAQYDPLTELPNRRYFLERLDAQLALARRRNFAGSVLFVDLDHFKPINDSLGHPVGDELLQSVTRRLRERLRREDFIARIGGDEFAVLVAAVDQGEDAAANEAVQLGQVILELLREPFEVAGQMLYIGASIGFCIFPAQGDTTQDILRRADTAMYAAKRQGRAAVRRFSPDMEADNQARLARLGELHQALKNNAFRLFYQPQFNNAGDIVGIEALLRWQHPQLGLVGPDDFIDVAEESGLILQIGDWVFAEAAHQYREWRRQALLPGSFQVIAINVSARQFVQPSFAARLIDQAERLGVDPARFELELTETVLADNLQAVSGALQSLRDAGFHFAIDDFGTGYSSLNYLKRLPVETLKIDRTFVRDLPDSESDTRIVETILAMASHLGLTVVAEGVETDAQLAFLQSRGCNLFQGFRLARPMSAEALTDLLTSLPRATSRD